MENNKIKRCQYMLRVLYFIPLVFFIFSTKIFAANVYIPLNNPIYFEIDRLKSLGYLESLVSLTKPYNTDELREALSELESDVWAAKVAELMREVERYETNGVLDTSLNVYYATEDVHARYDEGLALGKERGGFEIYTRLQYLSDNGFSLVATPSFRNTIGDRDDDDDINEVNNLDEDDKFFLRDTYLQYSFYNMNWTLGRQALWWGTGKHGTLLLSDNAKSIDMIRLSNDKALKYNAFSFDYDIFFGRMLEQDDIVNPDGSIGSGNPKMFGMQLSMAFSPYFQMSAYRTAIFGGADRPEDFSTIMDVIFPFGGVENEADQPGDQKAGFTAKISVPNDVQPFALYGEAAGEDEASGWPSMWSFIGGMDLVDLAHTKGLNLNFEYLQMSDTDGFSRVWYEHHLYREGYTNDGFIMGHAHGGIGKQFDAELTYQVGLVSTYSGGYRRETFLDDASADTLYFQARYRLGDEAEFRLDLLGSSIDSIESAEKGYDNYGVVKLNYTYLLW